MAATLGGSTEAFRQLVERYQRPVLSLIGRMVRDRALAEDLAQEVFVKTYTRLDSYEPGRRFSSWIFRIAHNRTLDHLRRRGLDEVPITAERDGETWELPIEEPGASPHQRTEGRELGSTLEAALGDLRPDYREVLVLRFAEDLSYQEIADVTGKAMNTVKVHIHRARKQLASALAARGYDPAAP